MQAFNTKPYVDVDAGSNHGRAADWTVLSLDQVREHLFQNRQSLWVGEPGFRGEWLLYAAGTSRMCVVHPSNHFNMSPVEPASDERGKIPDLYTVEQVHRLIELHAERRAMILNYISRLLGELPQGFKFRRNKVTQPDLVGIFDCFIISNDSHYIRLEADTSRLVTVKAYTILGPGRKHQIGRYHNVGYFDHRLEDRLDRLALGRDLGWGNNYGYMPTDGWYAALRSHLTAALLIKPEKYKPINFTERKYTEHHDGAVQIVDKLVRAKVTAIVRLADDGRVRYSGVEIPETDCWFLLDCGLINNNMEGQHATLIFNGEQCLNINRVTSSGDIIGVVTNSSWARDDLGPRDKELLELALAKYLKGAT